MLLPITLMILVTAHADKLDASSSGQSEADRSSGQIQDRGFSTSGINSNVGSTFSTINPSFNPFNQGSGGSNGVGEIISTQLTGSSVIGAPGSSNLGRQGSSRTFGSSRGSGFNFGSQAGPTLQNPIFNIGRPGSPAGTGFRSNFQQLPNIFLGPNSPPQASRPFLVFPSGPSQRLSSRFSPIHRFTPGPSIRPNYGAFSSSIPSSPISFSTINSQPRTGTGFGSQFSVSPLRSTFQGSNSGTDISPGNLQSSVRLISNPSLISSAGTGFQQPSQSASISSSSSDGSNPGTSSSAITFNSGPQIISAFDSGIQLPSQSSGSSDGSNSGSSSSNVNQNTGSSIGSIFGPGFQQSSQGPSSSSSSSSGSNSGTSPFSLSSDPSLGSTFVIGAQQPSQSPSTNTRSDTGSIGGPTLFNFGQILGNNGNAGNLRGGYLPPNP